VQEEHVEDIRNEDKAKKEEDLVEVVVSLFAITVGHKGTMRKSVRTRHACHVNNLANFTAL